MKVKLSLVALFSLVAFLAGCEDQTKTKIQYMPDMADSPTVKAQEDYLDPPEDAVAMSDLPYSQSPDDADFFQNPFPKSEQLTEKGKELYNVFCTPCHGAGGKGDGKIIGEDTGYTAVPPDITNATNKARPDSFFFHKISVGGAIMPAYAHAIDQQERWLIVNYLRTLQGGDE